jgi:hypothetical protein
VPNQRILFIVAAERGDLLDLLREKFADVPDAVEIVPDRRAGDRRQRELSVSIDRRRTERRRRDIDADLRAIGWAVVRRT